ncbi:MAG: HU family DNA-binding protein [Gammaproteobacteria bacterium]
MNKSDLIDAMQQESGLTKVDVGKALDAFIKSVSGALSKGDSVVLTGFGSFVVRHRAARMGINPRDTSTKISIPAANVPAFKAGKQLKEAVKS